ncbi:hypothetical protein BDY24DRAFT_381597 [Mrakia frigida]|uniref:uncharacterized protein n=1 Tax=Mrakia frigida TaxID=29902 RepID=UPI003FCBFB59
MSSGRPPAVLLSLVDLKEAQGEASVADLFGSKPDFSPLCFLFPNPHHFPNLPSTFQPNPTLPLTMNNLTGNHSTTTTGATGATGGGSNGDFMDKAVDALGTKSGHTQSHGTTEKISDGIKSGIQKMTGKTVPGGDKEFR